MRWKDSWRLFRCCLWDSTLLTSLATESMLLTWGRLKKNQVWPFVKILFRLLFQIDGVYFRSIQNNAWVTGVVSLNGSSNYKKAWEDRWQTRQKVSLKWPKYLMKTMLPISSSARLWPSSSSRCVRMTPCCWRKAPPTTSSKGLRSPGSRTRTFLLLPPPLQCVRKEVYFVDNL